MTRLLIFGLKDPAGGVESAVMSYVRHFDHDAIAADFAVFGADFSLAPEIESMGGKVLYLPVRRRDPLGYRAAAEKIFRDDRYDAVWCHFSGLTNIDFLINAKKYGVPLRAAHAHTASLPWGSPLMKYPVIAAHEKNKRVIDKYATHLFACSRSAAAFMYGEKNAAKAMIVPNAADLSRFAVSDGKDARKSLGIPEDAFVAGHVGRMCVAKNQKFLIDIFAALHKINPNAVLLFVGDGELRDEVRAHAAASGCGDAVVFTGARTDLPGLYAAMDVFCLPSLTEGFPVTAVEAQACGLPCVVSAQAVEESVNISGAVRFVSLAASPEAWAKELLSAGAQGKRDCRKALEQAGFEIVSAAKKLQDFFI